MRWLLPRLMEWHAMRPDVPVELTTTVQHGVDFRREGFDAAVVHGEVPNQGLRTWKLFDEQLTPVCAPSLLEGKVPLKKVDDLAKHMLLPPSRDEQDWRLWLDAKAVLPFPGNHRDSRRQGCLSLGSFFLLQYDDRGSGGPRT